MHSGSIKNHSFCVWRGRVPAIRYLAVVTSSDRLNTQSFFRLACAFGFLSACAQVATVKNVTPVPPSAAAVSGAHAASARDEERSPEVALSQDLNVAARAWAALKRDPGNARSRQLYNYSVGRVVSLLQDTWKLPDAGAVTIRTGSSAYHLTFSSDIKLFDNPHQCHFIPADELALSGKDYDGRVCRDGVGAPVLAETDNPVERAREQFLLSDRIYYGMTGVLQFHGSEARLRMMDPLVVRSTLISGHNYPLAADFSIGPAMILAKTRPQRLGFIRLIRPAKYAYTARLVRLQPYDANKIPVLMIHGLQDTGATWAPLLNELRSDPEINRRYQFWVYSYPSGYPFPYSAELLREELDRVDKAFPNHKKLVVIGHSMGGLLSRLIVTDSTLRIWDAFFGKPPEQVSIDPADKQLFERVLIFKHRSEVNRVIFISTPHRGSAIASNWIGRIGSALVELPPALKKLHAPTSIDTLSPNDRFVRILNTLPIADHTLYYSIIGDRGRGDTPHSSDGVVPYWSSHLDGAQSERIVPSGHSAHENKEGMEEVDRILRLNLGR
jgi:pimeloyl-ACP methyl ester carboxylesterase